MLRYLSRRAEGRYIVYLKSLELQGFKSFPDKTKLTFEGGSTVIVGPNGSGKSNISDAMRWVLGEVSSKSIRGTKMEDIIFGGADNRRPMGYAEVSVTFDNTGMIGRLDCPYDEVTVTRRYYRAGESEYFINRRAVRLRDIYELFMNTGIGRDGYSIIGQGKIAEIISRKSDERRSIFEDASGIAKYRMKKSETERKLKATEENMTRVTDIFAEVEAQVGPLEKEAQKAKRAIELLELKKQVDVQLWLFDTERIRTEIAKSEEGFRHAELDLQTAENSIRAFEVQNARLFEASQSNKLESAKILGEIRECTEQNHALDSEYQVRNSNTRHAEEMVAQARGSLFSVEKSLESEAEASEARARRLAELSEALHARRAEHAEAEQTVRQYDEQIRETELALAQALDDVKHLEAEAVDVRVRMSVIENARASGSDRNTSILSELENYQRISDELKAKCEMANRAVETYAEKMNEVQESMDGERQTLSALYAERDALSEQQNATRLRCDATQQRIDTFRAMEEALEGYSGSVRFVMKQYAEKRITERDGSPCGRIYGPLSRIISVEDRYLTAIETALGAALQHIVVEDESVAKAAMHALRRAEAGRATFLPLTSMKEQTATKEMTEASGFLGYVAVADELVTADGQFRHVLSSLLGRTLIFDTIDHATAMAKSLGYRVKAVTLDGQQINVGGSFTGGSVRKNGNILGRAGEIKRLEAELADLEKALHTVAAKHKALEDTIAQHEDTVYEAEEKHKLLAVMQNAERASAEQLTAKLDANETLMEKLRTDFEDIARQKEQLDEDIRALEVREKELGVQIGEINAWRSEKDIARAELTDRRGEAADSVTALFIAISELQKDVETENAMGDETRVRMDGYLSQKAALEERIAELRDKLAAYAEEQKRNREAYAEGEARLSGLNAERAKIEEGGLEFERALNEVNAKLRDKMSQKELIFRDYTKWENKLSNLRDEQDKLASKLYDEHELTRSDAVALGYPAIDASMRPETAQRQTEYRNKLRAIGNVDLDAVNKYKEVKERYDYMDAQIKDLSAARADLLDIIGKLEGEMKTAFVESFNQINENFNRVFAELFGGGSAELSLTDPENVLESGIEIKAAPPGKIIKNLVQLSGGEQSFIAIALFFAILQVNPTPFCILDEIEAALDEVNVARFAEYIKRYASGTQFILITHRRGTMEAANRLYGVTMPERGISKVLELDIGKISKKEGEDWDGIFG